MRSAPATAALVVYVLSPAAIRAAQPIDESEPNGSFGAAQPLPAVASVDAFLGSNDVDFFSVMVSPGGYITAQVFDLTPGDSDLPFVFDNDSIMGVFSPAGIIVVDDDDDGPGRLSAWHGTPSPAGAWGFAVSAFPDFTYSGDHESFFGYRFVIATRDTHTEASSNDSFVSAESPGPAQASTLAIGGELSPGDTDWFAVPLRAGDLITAGLFDRTPGDTDEPVIGDSDPLLGVFTPDGALLELDDDDGPGRLSALHFFAPQTGVYRFAVSGTGDFLFTGAHGESLGYRLVISGAVPAPGSLLVVVAALAAGGARRRMGAGA